MTDSVDRILVRDWVGRLGALEREDALRLAQHLIRARATARTIVLDFTETGTVSSGFANELFVTLGQISPLDEWRNVIQFAGVTGTQVKVLAKSLSAAKKVNLEGEVSVRGRVDAHKIFAGKSESIQVADDQRQLVGVAAIPETRVAIVDLLALSQQAAAQPDFRAEQYRKHREGWVLARYAMIYNALPDVSRRLAFAEPGDSPGIPADFATYDSAGNHVADIEIVELTDTWEWWRPGVTIRDVKDPWAHLPGLLRQKYQKAVRYRFPTWLIVYDNASSGIFAELSGVKFGAADTARRETTDASPPSNVTAIWVLSSDATRIARADVSFPSS
jgi:hypothetical protein